MWRIIEKPCVGTELYFSGYMGRHLVLKSWHQSVQSGRAAQAPRQSSAKFGKYTLSIRNRRSEIDDQAKGDCVRFFHSAADLNLVLRVLHDTDQICIKTMEPTDRSCLVHPIDRTFDL